MLHGVTAAARLGEGAALEVVAASLVVRAASLVELLREASGWRGAAALPHVAAAAAAAALAAARAAAPPTSCPTAVNASSSLTTSTQYPILAAARGRRPHVRSFTMSTRSARRRVAVSSGGREERR